MEIIRTAAECSRFRACCFSSATLRIIRYSFAELKRSQTAPDVQFFRQYCRMRPHTSAMRCDSVCYILGGRQAVSFSKDAATGFFPVENIADRDRLQNSKIIFNDTARQDIQKRNEVT